MTFDGAAGVRPGTGERGAGEYSQCVDAAEAGLGRFRGTDQ
ncbi:hypothetical protein [Streptomyces buecherae]|nr:hypothetical protein [Streptomyces buecherae]